MSYFQKNQQIQLSDGKTYLYIGTISMDNHEYHFLSPKKEDIFIVGEVIDNNSKQSFKIIKDINLIQKIQDYYLKNPESLS